MRDFFWEYFSVTGNLDAYLLYRETAVHHETEQSEDESDHLTEFSSMLD